MSPDLAESLKVAKAQALRDLNHEFAELKKSFKVRLREEIKRLVADAIVQIKEEIDTFKDSLNDDVQSLFQSSKEEMESALDDVYSDFPDQHDC